MPFAGPGGLPEIIEKKTHNGTYASAHGMAANDQLCGIVDAHVSKNRLCENVLNHPLSTCEETPMKKPLSPGYVIAVEISDGIEQRLHKIHNKHVPLPWSRGWK